MDYIADKTAAEERIRMYARFKVYAHISVDLVSCEEYISQRLDATITQQRYFSAMSRITADATNRGEARSSAVVGRPRHAACNLKIRTGLSYICVATTIETTLGTVI